MRAMEDVERSVEALLSLIGPMKGGEQGEKLGRVSVYAGSVLRSLGTCRSILGSSGQKNDLDSEKQRKVVEGQIRALESSISSSIRFARLNLDQAMVRSLETLAPRPRSATKAEEKKRMEALQRWFDDLDDPGEAMIDHYRSTSHPLDKYLLAGPWGFGLFKKKNTGTQAYYHDLCSLIRCTDPVATELVLGYSDILRALDLIEVKALEAAGALEREAQLGIA